MNNHFAYSRHSDGKRFLINTVPSDVPPEINVITNWRELAASAKPLNGGGLHISKLPVQCFQNSQGPKFYVPRLTAVLRAVISELFTRDRPLLEL